ncbi:hypothetical protein LHP98_11020 [Rhodobacter sp. Har01]|uniref:hypothetical protein n=1 Tax=Rhodobacter sp. Har01 TaxID=2883999 RepID=UPI001D0643F7|nr:hypothetical protein [Rhodobacter sp. Har01]MCB6178659.1 hypothetical protein [Rhodobacter sp. Har01]
MNRPAFGLVACAAVTLLAAPARAEVTDQTCRLAWAQLSARMETTAETIVSGMRQPAHDGWCRVTRLVLDLPGAHQPDVHIDRLSVRGGMVDWLTGAEGAPGALELTATGLRLVADNGLVDDGPKAQVWPKTIDMAVSLRWDAEARLIEVEQLTLDLPGENDIALFATLSGGQGLASLFSPPEALGLAVTEARLSITSHGMFETHLLPAMALAVVPGEDDVGAAAEALRVQALATIADLPADSFPDATKDALSRLVQELPRPAGRLNLAFHANPGFGPVRFAGFALTGVPKSMAEAAPLFQGVTVEAEWTHEAASE